VIAGIVIALAHELPELEVADAHAAEKPSGSGCRLQDPQRFLVRSSYVKRGQLQDDPHRKAVRFRAKHYGNVEGLELERYNPESAYAQAKLVRFMGIAIEVHEKIAPALRCVQRRIKKTCTKKAERYTPQAMNGFRKHNSFRGLEISNHVFGIAVDIDPDRNPCCGCVEPWPDHPACKEKVDSVFQRTAMPRCWINAFERYGFYWLGRDAELRDTMHFEFLGDPDRIVAP
jgi:hypothetical protein